MIFLSFGSKLRALRLEYNLTQTALAKKINLSKANVSKYEADLIEPNLDTLVMISSLFNVSVDYLLGVSDKTAPEESIISEEMKNLINSYSDLNAEEMKKVVEYIEFLKLKRNV